MNPSISYNFIINKNITKPVLIFYFQYRCFHNARLYGKFTSHLSLSILQFYISSSRGSGEPDYKTSMPLKRTFETDPEPHKVSKPIIFWVKIFNQIKKIFNPNCSETTFLLNLNPNADNIYKIKSKTELVPVLKKKLVKNVEPRTRTHTRTQLFLISWTWTQNQTHFYLASKL